MSKRDRGDKGRLAPFVPLLKDTLQTPAWRSMSHGARSLYVALRGRVANDCRNNGRVFLPTRAACVETGSDTEQVVRWFRELQHFGFIVQMVAGQLGVDGKGKAPHWRLTELGARNAEGGLDMPTRDFLCWTGKRFHRNSTTFEKQNPARESRNTPLGKAETHALGKAETQTALTARESRSIETPKALGKAEAYLDNHLHVERRSGAQLPTSAARDPHLGATIASIRDQVLSPPGEHPKDLARAAANGKAAVEWPAEGYKLTGPQLEALCLASGRNVRSFARHLGIDMRKLRRKTVMDFSVNDFALSGIDQMRREIADRRRAS